MLYNQSYNLLAEARDNPDMNLLATSHNVSKETMRRHLESLNEGIPSSLYVRLDNERVELSETGKVYANACEKINRLVIDAELKAEKFKREREGSISVASLSRSVDRKLKSLAHETRFKVRFFDPSGVNASSSLKVCGRDFDAAMTFYDDSFLKRNRLKAFELYNDNIAVAFSKNSENAGKKKLDIEDLYEKKLFVPHEKFNRRIDVLVGDLRDFHSRIEIVHYDVITMAFLEELSSCEDFLLVSQHMDLSSFGLNVLPVDWNYKVQYGLVYSQKPESKVEDLIRILEKQ